MSLLGRRSRLTRIEAWIIDPLLEPRQAAHRPSDPKDANDQVPRFEPQGVFVREESIKCRERGNGTKACESSECGENDAVFRGENHASDGTTGMKLV